MINFRYYWKLVKKITAWRAAEFYIISFPKSGRTGLRSFLSHYFSLQCGKTITDDFISLRRPCSGLPRLFFAHRGFWGEVLSKSSKENISTEDIAHRNIPGLRGERVIFISRDPRDAVVSHYFSLTKRNKSAVSRQRIGDIPLSEFIRSPKFGIGTIIDYMNAWYEAKWQFKSFYLIRYEDYRARPHEEFYGLLEELGISPNQEWLEKAISESSFEKMREREQAGAFSTERLSPGDVSDPASYKMRKGKVGGFSEEMNKADIEYVNNALVRLHPDFGYHSEQCFFSGSKL